MNCWSRLFFVVLGLVVLAGCQPPKPPAGEAIPELETLSVDEGRVLRVLPKSENVRSRPNGDIVGKLKQNEKISVLRRVGNWIEFTHPKYYRAYIWGPSVGYDEINLYSPFFYYDTTRQQFYDLEYFQRIFGMRGKHRQDFPDGYELIFTGIGLGSHHEVFSDNFPPPARRRVEHGITMFVDKRTTRIMKARVDYRRPIQSYEQALRKSGLPSPPPTEESRAHLIWARDVLVRGLIVDLERADWDSNLFSSIWFILPPPKPLPPPLR